MKSAFSTGTEMIYFTDSLNRVLAGDIKSDMNMPPFNKSTVDGFACRKEDMEADLEIIETIPAGIRPKLTVSVKQCSRIMTGAPVPEGADMVFMVEDSLILSSGKVKFTAPFYKENIAIKGEDVREGDTVMRSGVIVRPQEIAVLATVGCSSVEVSKMPKIAVISSGDELVEPSEKPGLAQIRNTNAYQLMAQINRAGAIGKYYGIARDNEQATYDIVKKAISESDMLLMTGGVSMGDFDFIPSVLKKAGVKILFSRVKVQPGKPTTFGVHPDTLVFGLPGNPVSSFIQFELLVKPLIYKMMGNKFEPLSISLPMAQKFSRKYADRMAWIPVEITKEGMVNPIEYHGSAHISSLVPANGIIALLIGEKFIEKGAIVSVRQV